MTPRWGFGVAMLPVGALCFYQAHFGRTCFQNGHFGRISSTQYFTVFRSLGGHASARRVSQEPCFRQAHCFVRGLLRFHPVPPNPTCAHSHIWGFPSVWLRHDHALHETLCERSMRLQTGWPWDWWVEAAESRSKRSQVHETPERCLEHVCQGRERDSEREREIERERHTYASHLLEDWAKHLHLFHWHHASRILLHVKFPRKWVDIRHLGLAKIVCQEYYCAIFGRDWGKIISTVCKLGAL